MVWNDETGLFQEDLSYKNQNTKRLSNTGIMISADKGKALYMKNINDRHQDSGQALNNLYISRSIL